MKMESSLVVVDEDWLLEFGQDRRRVREELFCPYFGARCWNAHYACFLLPGSLCKNSVFGKKTRAPAVLPSSIELACCSLIHCKIMIIIISSTSLFRVQCCDSVLSSFSIITASLPHLAIFDYSRLTMDQRRSNSRVSNMQLTTCRLMAGSSGAVSRSSEDNAASTPVLFLPIPTPPCPEDAASTGPIVTAPGPPSAKVFTGPVAAAAVVAAEGGKIMARTGEAGGLGMSPTNSFISDDDDDDDDEALALLPLLLLLTTATGG